MHHPSLASDKRHLAGLDLAGFPPAHRIYNPGLAIRPDGGYWLAYRLEDCMGRSSVWICEVDKSPGRAMRACNHWCAVPATDEHHAEDPRLVRTGDGMLLVWERVRIQGGKWVQIKLMCNVLDMAAQKLGAEIDTDFDGNGTTKAQKNWQFFNGPRGLSWVHWCNPLQVVEWNGLKVRTTGAEIKWGAELHGGSPPFEVAPGHWLMMVHGRVPDGRRIFRYYAAALTFKMDPEPRITGISRKPVLWASEEDPTVLCPRDPYYFPVVVFPTGLVEDPDGRFTLAAGINDSSIAFFRFTLADFDLVEPQDAATTTALDPMESTPSGLIRVRAAQNLFEGGHRYQPGEEFASTPDRAKCLGPLVCVAGDAGGIINSKP